MLSTQFIFVYECYNYVSQHRGEWSGASINTGLVNRPYYFPNGKELLLPAPIHRNYAMPSYETNVRLAQWNIIHLRTKRHFLNRCREYKLIPKGLRLRFNLAFNTSDSKLVSEIQEILNKASSQILDCVIKNVNESIEKQQKVLKDTRQTLNYHIGIQKTNEFVGKVRKEISKILDNDKKKLTRKLENLKLLQ